MSTRNILLTAQQYRAWEQAVCKATGDILLCRPLPDVNYAHSSALFLSTRAL